METSERRGSMGLLTAKELAARLKISARTLSRWRAAGRIPAGMRLCDRSVRWREVDVEQFINQLPLCEGRSNETEEQACEEKRGEVILD